MKIIKDLTKVNYKKGNSGRKYLVMHYTGNTTDTAKSNANYFRDINRDASAHYFVDNNEIYQVVEENDTSWAVGDGKGAYGITNSNSISIEMCGTNGEIAEATIKNALELVKSLMAKYNIPLSNVVRHYDASRKVCPQCWSANNWAKWNGFKARLGGQETPDNGSSNSSKPNGYWEWVERLQKECNAQGFSNQVVDGIAGSNTLVGCPQVRKGAKGNITKLLQEVLKNGYGIDTGAFDGIFGTNTENGVKEFQRRNGLSADGIVGTNTWRKILRL